MKVYHFKRLAGVGAFILMVGCSTEIPEGTAGYRVEEGSDRATVRVDNFGFYGLTLPLLAGDRSGSDPSVLETRYRGYLFDWAENLSSAEGSDYRYYNPVYLTTSEGVDVVLIPGEMTWLLRSDVGQEGLRDALELRQSRMRVQETFAATPKDQLVRFLRFGVFRFEKAWFERNDWPYGAEIGAGHHVYFFASNHKKIP